jgi:hypothetical protein
VSAVPTPCIQKEFEVNQKWARLFFPLFLLAVTLFISTIGFAQQDYVPRFDVFTGFSYLASPKLNLYQRGFNGEFGVNATRWLALGVDYSILNGNSSILPKYLDPSIQAQLAGLAPLFPPGYNLYVPYSARTQTFSAGPQINFRHFKPVTFFVRPALGAIHEYVTPNPIDPLQTAVVAQLVPSGHKSDTTYFYGAGGGIDYNATKHFGLRFGIDFVHTFLFDGFLAEPRNSVRLSIGPTFRFGHNVQ